jgi:hypothetical protein
MKLLLILFAFLWPGLVTGQTVRASGVVSPEGDTSFWYGHQKRNLNKLSMIPLDSSCNGRSLRIWTDKQVIEIRESADGKMNGRLISWADEQVPSNETSTNRTFVMTRQIMSDTAFAISELFWHGDIAVLPTDDSIASWQHGFDGITYIIEQSSGCAYSFRSYWTPIAQGDLKEAKIVQSFIDSVLVFADANTALKLFTKAIPYESYSNGGFGIAVRVLTPKQRKKYAQERRKYLSTLKK